jgi:23S rRNA (cytosine1962-C5)-methyltransferase
MFTTDQYELLDFGKGRRLERFGAMLLDRPCPMADAFPLADSAAWNRADARFDGREAEKGLWACRGEMPERWTVAHDRLRFELKRTVFGHVGLFAEQAENWDWIGRQGTVSPLPEGRERAKILNLFAYTGGSTLAAAAIGGDVTHVDAAKNIVAWARRNAECSGLGNAPIRWIAEDAVKFVKRELKRGNLYDAVILDPPSYGHGPRGEVWRLANHLPPLLSLCAELTAGRPRFILLTCHTLGYDARQLAEWMDEAGFSAASGRIEAKPLTITTATGRELPSGTVVRWRSDPRPPNP